MHIETRNSVALQTSQGQVAGKCNARIRVLFATASHTSATVHVARMFSLETLRKEWLAVNTFGQRAAGSIFHAFCEAKKRNGIHV